MDETLKISQYTLEYSVSFCNFQYDGLAGNFYRKVIYSNTLPIELHSTYLLFYIEQVFLSERGQEKTLFTYP